jgi:hypothetical protein
MDSNASHHPAIMLLRQWPPLAAYAGRPRFVPVPATPICFDPGPIPGYSVL